MKIKEKQRKSMKNKENQRKLKNILESKVVEWNVPYSTYN